MMLTQDVRAVSSTPSLEAGKRSWTFAGWRAWTACILFLATSLGSCVALAQQPEDSQAARAESALRGGDFHQAAATYEELVKGQPRSAELWSNLGTARALGGDCPGALQAFDHARTLKPALFAPWYFSGFCHLQSHEEQAALKDLRHAVQLNPRDANAWFFLAQSAGNLDQVGTAFNALLRTLELNPTKAEAYSAAGKSALDLAVECYARLHPDAASAPYIHRLEGERDVAQGVWAPAIESFQKGVQAAPSEPDLYFALGVTYAASGKLPEAEEQLRKSLELLPNSTLARLELAQVLAREQKLEEAKKLVASVVPQQLRAKEEFDAYLTCATRMRMPEAVKAALQQAATHFPGDADVAQWKEVLASRVAAAAAESPATPGLGQNAKVGLAVRFALISDLPKGNFVAETFASSPAQYRALREAFLRDDLVKVGQTIAPRTLQLPTDPKQDFVLGELLHWLAFRFFEVLGQRFPDSEAAQMLAAENFSAAGDQDKALEIYQALLERKGPSPDLLRGMAQIYWTQHRWEDALKVLLDLMKMDPRDATLSVNAGRIYSYQHDLAKAQRYFRQAADIDPRMFEAHLGLGETLRLEGDEGGALQELLTAMHIAPENPRPHYELSQIYKKLEKREQAREEMEAFQRLQAQTPVQRARKERLLVPLE